MKVHVVERRGVVGGAAVTEEFHPGFRNSTASYTVSLLNPKVIAEMDLAGHGLADRRAQTAEFPAVERSRLSRRRRRTTSARSRNSPRAMPRGSTLTRRGSARWPISCAACAGDTARMRATRAGSPALRNCSGPRVWRAGCRDLDMTARRDLLALFGQSAGDMLDGWFESDPIKAVLGFDGDRRQLRQPLCARHAPMCCCTTASAR